MRAQWPTRILSFALALSMSVPTVAYGDEKALARAQEQIDAANTRFEKATQEYQDAKDAVSSLEAQIAQNEQSQAQLAAELPAQRERTAASIKTLYLFQQSSGDLLDIVLTAESFDSFIATTYYLDSILERNVAEVNALADMEHQLTQTQAELTTQRDAADQKRQQADEALQGASSALQDARTHKRELEAASERVKAAEAARRNAASNAQGSSTAPVNNSDAQTETSSQQTQTQQNESTAPEADTQTNTQSADQPTDQQDATTQQPADQTPQETAQPDTQPAPDPQPDPEPEPEPEPATPAPEESAETPTVSGEVADWASRIDAYLAGSPLAGYGAVFAQAAADYGVDPRISPAISCIESGKGAVCFLPHNAWGWGSASWPDWESAIHGHVSGFASIYGSTLTLSGAEMYASNDIYQEWYNLVLSEMNSI